MTKRQAIGYIVCLFFSSIPLHTSRRFNLLILLLVGTILVALYTNSFYSPWILDDQPNIVDNGPLHLTEISLPSLKSTFFAKPLSPGTLYRPLACMSFALNWWLSQNNTFGYHLVNISIHILTAFFLYLTCLELLKLVLSRDDFFHAGGAMALFASLFWAVNPLQTQAVTYIVQRMASMAALFSIVGILFYLKLRTTDNTIKRTVYGISTIAAFLCAIASKENAVVFPISLLLIEFIFFRSIDNIPNTIKKYKPFTFLLVLAIAGVLVLGALHLLAPYINHDGRTFSLTERILTQPRVLIFYLSQLFFPLASRLSLEHDVVLSTSPFTPWTTLPAILACLALIVFGLLGHRKAPLLSLAILFFFINHSVESSIIPLELMFEHRNYQPSLFLFLPVASWCIRPIVHSAIRPTRFLLPAIAIGLLVFFGINTAIRNQAWSSALVLMQDAHDKAPNSNRAATNLAKEYFLLGDLDRALSLSEQAFHLWHPTRNYAGAISLNAQGVVYNRRGDNVRATQLFQQSLAYLPQYAEAKKNLIVSLCKQNRYEEALAQFSDHSGNTAYRDPLLQAAIQLHLKQPEKALITLRTIPRENILAVEIMTGIGKSLSTMGHHRQAEFFLRQAAGFSPLAVLIQIENFLRDGKTEEAETACRQMFIRYRAADIFDRLAHNEPSGIPINRDLVQPFIIQQIPRG